MGARGGYGDDDMVITAKKDELLEKLKSNREIHEKEYQDALKGWKEAIIQARAIVIGDLEEEIRDDKISKKEPKSMQEYRRILNDEPTSNTEDYDQAIDMLTWHSHDEFKLDKTKFNEFVNNKWNWSSSHNRMTQQYTNIQPYNG